MKNIVSILVFLALAGFLGAQTWTWAHRGGGTSYDTGEAVYTIDSGYSFVAGNFQGTSTFGTTTLTSSGNYDIYVAWLDQDGNWTYAIKAGGTGADYVKDIYADNNGNSYVTGYFTGSMVFGAITLTSAGGYDAFVAKADFFGNWLWAVRGGSSSTSYSDMGDGIAGDNAGNIYVTGSYSGTADFGAYTLTSASSQPDIFVARLSGAGGWAWAVSAGGTYHDYGQGICVDRYNRIYVTGSFSLTATFGTLSATTGDAGMLNSDAFVARINMGGTWQWVKRAGGGAYISWGTGEFNDQGLAVSCDFACNVYVAGCFRETADFGATSYSSYGNCDTFVAKLDYNGNWIWAKRAGQGGVDVPRDITTLGGGVSFVTGNFENSATFGTHTVASAGGWDIFVAKIDSGGSWNWAFRAGVSGTITNGLELGTGISHDTLGNIYTTGIFRAYSSQWIYFGGTGLQSLGQNDMYIAKLTYAGTPLAPTGVYLTTQMNIAPVGSWTDTVHWNAVGADTGGAAISPSYYKVYYCGTSPNGPYTYLGQSTGTSFSYTFGGPRTAVHPFYCVKAVVDNEY